MSKCPHFKWTRGVNSRGEEVHVCEACWKLMGTTGKNPLKDMRKCLDEKVRGFTFTRQGVRLDSRV